MAKKPPIKKASVASKAAGKVAKKVAVKAAPAKKAVVKSAPAKKTTATKKATVPAAQVKKAAPSKKVAAAQKVKVGVKAAAGKTVRKNPSARSVPVTLQLGDLKVIAGALTIDYGDGNSLPVADLLTMVDGHLVVVVQLVDGAKTIRSAETSETLAALKCFLEDYAVSVRGGCSTCCK